MGRWVDAEEHLAQPLAEPDRWGRHHRAGWSALAQVREHVTSLTVTANVAGAELRVNDVSVGRLPRAAVRVATGPVVIDVVAEGYEPHRESVQAVAPSTQRTVTPVARPVRVTVLGLRDDGDTRGGSGGDGPRRRHRAGGRGGAHRAAGGG